MEVTQQRLRIMLMKTGENLNFSGGEISISS
jgi:hypothetical protein